MVLTLDTNQTRMLGLTRGAIPHTRFTLLRGIAEMHRMPLALTETVLEETLGIYEREVRRQLQVLERTDSAPRKRERARDELLRMVPCWTSRPEFFRGDDFAAPRLKWAVDSHRKQLAGITLTLAKPDGADAEGNRREIARQLPAVESGDRAGKGSRDTAIWLTVLAAAKRMQWGNLYFVARDKGFGYPLHPELRAEAERAGAAHLVFYNDIDLLIDRLSSPADLPEPVDDLLSNDIVHAALRNSLKDGNFRVALRDWLNDWSDVWPVRRDDLAAEPRSDDSRAARIGETTLVAINRIWRVKRHYTLSRDPSIEQNIEFTIQLALLACYENGDLQRAVVVSRGGILEQQSG